jgi:hypothetical protein
MSLREAIENPQKARTALAELRRAEALACRDYLQANFTGEQRAHMNAVMDRFGGCVEVDGVWRICRSAKGAA